MIRDLPAQEISRIRRLGTLFADEVKLFTGYDPEKFEATWSPVMEAGLAKVFYSADAAGELTGFLGATFLPDLYSGVPAAQAQFWFVDAAHRAGSTSVRLFDAFEAEATRRGAVKRSVGHKIGIHEEAMKNFFIRRGYVPGEILYWKH